MTRPDGGQQAVDRPQTIEQLLLPVLPPAYNFALRLTRDEADAEDLLQEAAARACRFFDQFQAGTNFRAWFFKILANCFYNRERRNRRRGEHFSIEDTPALYLYARTAEVGLHESETNPASALLTRLETEQIAHALNELPEEYRTVATLYFVEDLKYEEIADVLGIPLGTVRSRLHRGRRMLQKKLWNVALEHGLVPETADD
jgi:RNA polymerase sigma-70 factor (ECF subfamily)